MSTESVYAESIESEESFGSFYVNLYPFASSISGQEVFGTKSTITEIVQSPGTEVYVESQLPAFVRDDHPRFVEFLKAYYSWLDQNNNIGEKIRRIKEHQDIDLAGPEFAEQFYKEFLAIVPRNVLADKRILVKYIKQFYRARGTENSYRFFFRMLFNTDVEFYYPVKDILKVSDGKWVQDRFIRVIPIAGSSVDFQNKKIVSRTTGVSARVDLARKIKTELYKGYELVLNTSSLNGVFLPDEIIQTEDGSALAKISPIPTNYSFVFDTNEGKYKTGTGYKIGDTFKVLNSKGRDARVRVTSIIPNQRTIMETIITPTADSVENSAGRVKEIFLGKKNVFSIIRVICANDNGNYIEEPTMDTAGVSPTGIVHEDVKIRYQLSQNEDGDVYLKLSPLYLDFVPQGRVKVVFDHLIEDESGQIEKLQIVNFGMEYGAYTDTTKQTFNIQLNQESCVTKNFTGSGAEITIKAGALGMYPGYYANEDGQLSSSKKIQDGEYYQQYSYVTISDRPTGEYKDKLKNMLHPAGLRFYGHFRTQSTLSARIKPATLSSAIRREFKQFPKPVRPGCNPPLHSEPTVQANSAIRAHLTQDRRSAKHGPTNYSIFRDRFDYRPMERYNSSQEVSGSNSEYWIANIANTSIDKFKDIIPITLEGVTNEDQIQKVSEYRKYVMQPSRGTLIYNTTKRIVEMYTGNIWIEINSNRRINILPDAVVSTTGIIVNENGDIEMKVTSVRTPEMLNDTKKHKITIL